MSLLPDSMSRFTEFENYEKAEEFNVMDCKECGACSYVCPSNRPLVQWFKLAKGNIVKQRRIAQEELKRKEAQRQTEGDGKPAAA